MKRFILDDSALSLSLLLIYIISDQAEDFLYFSVYVMGKEEKKIVIGNNEIGIQLEIFLCNITCIDESSGLVVSFSNRNRKTKTSRRITLFVNQLPKLVNPSACNDK